MRTLSTTAKQAVFAQQTGKVFLSIIAIDHDDLASPIRLVNNTENITSRGNVYTACAFNLEMPDESNEKLPRAQITIANADRAITASLRGVTTPGTLTHEIILSDTPDVIEAGPFVYQVESIDWTAKFITARLSYEDLLNEKAPATLITPTYFPGLFNAS